MKTSTERGTYRETYREEVSVVRREKEGEGERERERARERKRENLFVCLVGWLVS